MPASAHGDINDDWTLEDRASHATSGRGRQTIQARANCTTSTATAACGETIAHIHTPPPPSVLVIAKATMIPTRV
jgi:hypothetical protein